MDSFPGDICVDCHRQKVNGDDATKEYGKMMGAFKGDVLKKDKK